MSTMTKLETPVTRETSIIVREGGSRPLVVTMSKRSLIMRPKGTHHALELSWEHCWLEACRISAQKIREERRAQRQQRMASPRWGSL